MPRLLVVDNYDSFTWNLVQAFQVLGAEVEVVRNDRITVAGALGRAPTHLVVSPGPGRPRDAGASLELLAAFLGRVPVLGVCLGHQCLVEFLGGRVVPARQLVHGAATPVHHDGRGLFRGLPNPFPAGRYHSLAVADLPPELEVAARAPDGEVMAVRHRRLPAYGIQFHPESVLTPEGPRLLGAFLETRGPRAAQGG